MGSNIKVTKTDTYLNNIHSLAARQPYPWGGIAGKIDDNFKYLKDDVSVVNKDFQETLSKEYYKKSDIDDKLKKKLDLLVDLVNIKKIGSGPYSEDTYQSLLRKEGENAYINIDEIFHPVVHKTVFLYTTWPPSSGEDVDNPIPPRPQRARWNLDDDTITNIEPNIWTTSNNIQEPIWLCSVSFNSNLPNNPVFGPVTRISGADGENGVDGNNIQFIYMLSDTDPKSLDRWVPDMTFKDAITKYGWTDHPTGISEDCQTEWFVMRTKTSQIDPDDNIDNPDPEHQEELGKWSVWTAPARWSRWGVNGMDGDGVQYIFRTTTEGVDLSEQNSNGDYIHNPTPEDWETNVKYQSPIAEYVPKDLGWSDDPSGVDQTNSKEWVCKRKRIQTIITDEATGQTKKIMKWGRYSNPALWTHYSREVIGYVVEFGASKYAYQDDAGNNVDGWSFVTEWSKNSPIVTLEKKFLWKRFKRIYSDNPNKAVGDYAYELVGKLGDKGLDGSDIKFIYALTKSSSDAPTVPNNELTPGEEPGPEGIEVTDPSTGNKYTWFDDPQLVNDEYKYQWMCFARKPAGGKWPSYWTGPTIWNIFASSAATIDLTNNTDSVPCNVHKEILVPGKPGEESVPKKAPAESYSLINMFIGTELADIISDHKGVICEDDLITDGKVWGTFEHITDPNEINKVIDDKEITNITSCSDKQALVKFTINDNADYSNTFHLKVNGVYQGITYTGFTTFAFNKILLGENAELYRIVPIGVKEDGNKGGCSVVKYADTTQEFVPNNIGIELKKTSGSKIKVKDITEIPEGYTLIFTVNYYNGHELAGREYTFPAGSKMDDVGIKDLKTYSKEHPGYKMEQYVDKVSFTYTLKYYTGGTSDVIIADQETVPVVMDGKSVLNGNLYAVTDVDQKTGDPLSYPKNIMFTPSEKIKFGPGHFNTTNNTINFDDDDPIWDKEKFELDWADSLEEAIYLWRKKKNPELLPPPEGKYDLDICEIAWQSTGKFNVNGLNQGWTPPIRLTGEKGDVGADGNGLYYIYYRPSEGQPGYDGNVDDIYTPDPISQDETVKYKFNEVTANGCKWTDSPQGVDAYNPIEYMCFANYISDHTAPNKMGRWSKWIGPNLWSKYGVNGTDGDGIKYAFCRTKGPIIWNWVTERQGTEDDLGTKGEIPHGGMYDEVVFNNQYHTRWTDNPQDVDEEWVYEWVSTSKFKEYKKDKDGVPVKQWSMWTSPTIWKTYNLTKLTVNVFKLVPETDGEPNPPALPTSLTDKTHGWFNVEENIWQGTPPGWSASDAAAGIPKQFEYIWMCNGILNNEGYPRHWSKPIRITGRWGDNGTDGKTIYYIYTTNPNAGDPTKMKLTGGAEANFKEQFEDKGRAQYWTDSPVGITGNVLTEWVSYATWVVNPRTSNGGEWSYFSPKSVWAQWGKTGLDGDGVEYIFLRNNDPNGPKRALPSGTEEIHNTTPGEWTDDPIGVDINHQYEWVSKRKYGYKFDSDDELMKKQVRVIKQGWSEPALWAKYGENGKDGKQGILGIQGPVGQRGPEGPQGPGGPGGQILYCAGVYDSTKSYTMDAEKAPYVWDNDTNQYWVLNKEKPTGDPGSGGSGWVQFEHFDAIYSDVGVFGNALVGSAVFNKEYMFSQQGVNGNYLNFNNGPAGGFDPNVCLNMENGNVSFRGNVRFGPKTGQRIEFDNNIMRVYGNSSGNWFEFGISGKYATLSYWDGGKMIYDLGPKGYQVLKNPSMTSFKYIPVSTPQDGNVRFFQQIKNPSSRDVKTFYRYNCNSGAKPEQVANNGKLYTSGSLSSNDMGAVPTGSVVNAYGAGYYILAVGVPEMNLDGPPSYYESNDVTEYARELPPSTSNHNFLNREFYKIQNGRITASGDAYWAVKVSGGGGFEPDPGGGGFEQNDNDPGL